MDVSGRANRSGVLLQSYVPTDFDKLVPGEFAGHRVDEFVQTLALLLVITTVQALFARLRIDQTIGLWWHYGVLLALGQWFLILIGKGAA